MLPTPYYQDDYVTLIHGDCADVLPTLPMSDLLLTDPPYGIGAANMTMGKGVRKRFSKGEWDNERPDLRPFIARAPLQCIWGGNYFTDQLPPTNDWLCWHKKNDGRSFSEFELAWSNFGTNTRIISIHWATLAPKVHITEKPIPVMEWCLSFVPRVRTVLDPFAGSGSTGVACKRQRIHCTLIERDLANCRLAAKRLAETQPMMEIALVQPRPTQTMLEAA